MTGQTTITIIKIRLVNVMYAVPLTGRKLQILGGTNMSSEIRDMNLAESGEQKIEWVKRNCDLLRMLEE